MPSSLLSKPIANVLSSRPQSVRLYKARLSQRNATYSKLTKRVPKLPNGYIRTTAEQGW